MILEQSFTFDGVTYRAGTEAPPGVAARVQGEDDGDTVDLGESLGGGGGDDDLETLNKDELQDIASEEGVEGYSTLNKKPLIEAIRENRNA